MIIEPYDDKWLHVYNELSNKIIERIGNSIHRIDHIGSTAIYGLAAKPIIDIQISVTDLNNIETIKRGLSTLGYHHREDNPDLSKRYFRENTGMPRTHIHVRQSGSWSEQFNLLFRDFLREHEREKEEYAQVKYDLASRYQEQREQYVEGKTDIIWRIMIKANKWSQEIGWKPANPE